ncbi:hypothetical protein I598_1288 [Isoptericola dokdonensis DS-3]|uniref:Uncharacterized protein n=1 Tax=Isoptericola dokdonensis DS-3 TaxID=1300344 RepID=A0A168F3G7_9MICO|nr:hypothetical protein I598_1288 [Isoptericola dokdonensis DS-3]
MECFRRSGPSGRSGRNRSTSTGGRGRVLSLESGALFPDHAAPMLVEESDQVVAWPERQKQCPGPVPDEAPVVENLPESGTDEGSSGGRLRLNEFVGGLVEDIGEHVPTAGYWQAVATRGLTSDVEPINVSADEESLAANGRVRLVWALCGVHVDVSSLDREFLRLGRVCVGQVFGIAENIPRRYQPEDENRSRLAVAVQGVGSVVRRISELKLACVRGEASSTPEHSDSPAKLLRDHDGLVTTESERLVALLAVTRVVIGAVRVPTVVLVSEGTARAWVAEEEDARSLHGWLHATVAASAPAVMELSSEQGLSDSDVPVSHGLSEPRPYDIHVCDAVAALAR